jgi:hypothetical protein
MDVNFVVPATAQIRIRSGVSSVDKQNLASLVALYLLGFLSHPSQAYINIKE